VLKPSQAIIPRKKMLRSPEAQVRAEDARVEQLEVRCAVEVVAAQAAKQP
jgi:hypothetical protein